MIRVLKLSIQHLYTEIAPGIHYRNSNELQWLNFKIVNQGWGLQSQFPQFCYFPNFSLLLKYTLNLNITFIFDRCHCISQASHGTLFHGKVRTFKHGSLGMGKVLSFNSFYKRSRKIPYICRLINECLVVRYYRFSLVSSRCAWINMFC